MAYMHSMKFTLKNRIGQGQDMKALGGEVIPENWHLGGKPTDGSSNLIFLLHLWAVFLNI